MTKWLTTKQAAEYLNLSPAVIRRHAREGIITSYKPGGKMLMFAKEDLDAFVKGDTDGEGETSRLVDSPRSE